MSIIRALRPQASNGLNDLIKRLKELGHDVKKIKLTGSSYTGRDNHFILNWGSGDRNRLSAGWPIFNKPESVMLSCDKVLTFKKLEEMGLGGALPLFTTEKAEAKRWMVEMGERVYCRTLTRASQGRGIVLANVPEELVDARLYTSRVNVKREVRIHVFGGAVIDFAQKKKMSSQRLEEEGYGEADEAIRSHAKGWVFAREGVSIPEDAKELAVGAVAALGLDFGAVDMAITEQGTFKIYEINSAPGLEGTTLESYVNAFQGHLSA